MPSTETRLLASLLDRLTDHEPAIRTEDPLNRAQTLRVLKASLRQDLTALLNTKRREEEFPGHYVEAENSILTFGIPDFSAYSLKSQVDQHRIRRAIAAAIRRFEPRLENVTVSLEQSNGVESGLCYAVEGLLRLEPAHEPIRFETVLQPESRQFLITGERS